MEALIWEGLDQMVITRHDGFMSDGALDVIENPDYEKFVVYGTIDEHRFFNRGGLVSVPKGKRAIPNPCYVAPHTIAVMYDGKVPICCNDYLGSAVFGNVAEKPLMDIWNGADYKMIRRSLKRGVFELDVCKECVGK